MLSIFSARCGRLAVAWAIFVGIAGLSLVLGLGVEAGPPAQPLAEPTIVVTKVFRQGWEGYGGVTDVTISRDYPDTNFEGSAYLILHCNDSTSRPEKYGALIRFDLSSIPRNAKVQAATFSLLTFSRNITDDLLVTFHVMSRTWEAIQVTWNRPANGQAWGTPGANDDWYDRRGEWESYALFSMYRPAQAWYDWDVTEAVQYWVEQPQWNSGAKLLAYIGQRRNVRYDAYASEAFDLNVRPKLVVTYTINPADPTPTDVPATPTLTPTRIPSGPIQTITLQQGVNGYYGARDTQLDRRAPDVNFSEGEGLHLRWQDKLEGVFVDRDECNPILRFDVSMIPSHALVTEATLHLYAYTRSNPSYLSVTSHRILRDWVASEATWNHAAAGVPWYAEGCGAVDRDFRKRESDWVDMVITNTWYSFNVQEMVQQWVWYPDRNFGILLKPHVDVNVGYTFYSSDAITPSLRPKLQVKYWLPPDVPTATPTLSGGATPTPSRTPTETSRPTATPTSTATWTPTATATPPATRTHTPTSTWTATASSTPTPSSTSTATRTLTATATATATPTHTPSPTASFTATPSPTATATATATASATATLAHTPSPTASSTPTPSPTVTETHTPTATTTATPTYTPSPTPSPTATETGTPTWTATASPTPSATPSPTFTWTATPTETSTAMPTATVSPAFTATETATPAPLQTTFDQDGASYVPWGMPLVVRFPAPVITNTVRFSLTPWVPFWVVWTSEEGGQGAGVATLFHEPLAPATRYTLRLSGGLTVDRRAIAPATWQFETAASRPLLPLLIKGI